jgi:hypothetical protein
MVQILDGSLLFSASDLVNFLGADTPPVSTSGLGQSGGDPQGDAATVPIFGKTKMVLTANQIVIGEFTVQPGPYRVAHYRSYAIGDADVTTKAEAYHFERNLIDYLDRYFAGWKLIRRVVELPGSYTPYKRVTYLLEVGSDADAETIRSRLRKGLTLLFKHVT